MISSVQTSRGSPLNTAVLARLAERWRGVGLFLACMDREAGITWQDSKIPRVISMCLEGALGIAGQVRSLPDAPQAADLSLRSPAPFLKFQAIPLGRKRKPSGWLIAVARTEQVVSESEELARLAHAASLDAPSLAQQARKLPLVPGGSFAALAAIVDQMHEEMQASAVTQMELSGATEQLSSLYEEISLLYKISSGMRFSQKPQAFLETVCREVQEIGNFRSVIVSLAAEGGEEAPAFKQAAVTVGHCPIGGEELLAALHEPIYDALNAGEPQVHNEIPSDSDWARLSPHVARFVCVPLERDHRPLGVMIALDKTDQNDFNSVDLKLLTNVGNQCSIFLENAALYQDMQGLFMGVLHALTRSIDAKDAYTRGHSQRVAELSRTLARKIGLPEEQCERIYLSGLLHDVGKIGVPESVLTKPGRLTDEEFEAIKKHPSIGAQILGNIKQLQDIIPGVLFHHERWDGRGYPHQLPGEKIPLMGRIICVADSFDAMTSTRTYRPARPLAEVLKEIERCGGSQFDPALARVFVTLDFGPYQEAIEEQAAATIADSKAPLLETANGGNA